MDGLDDKVAIVTGSGRHGGLGTAMAERLGEAMNVSGGEETHELVDADVANRELPARPDVESSEATMSTRTIGNERGR